MYIRYLAISAAILLLSPVNVLGSKTDLTGPRFGLPATNEKAAVSHSNFISRDFIGFLTGASPLGRQQRTTNSGNYGYNAGGGAPPSSGGYPYTQSEDEGGNDGDKQAGDVMDAGDDKPDRFDRFSFGGEAKKRSILATLTEKQPAVKKGVEGDGDDDNGTEAKRSLKARRRELARRAIDKRRPVKRSTAGTMLKAESGLDSTVQDAEKLVNGALSHTQSTVNSAALDLQSQVSKKVSGASSSSPLTTSKASTGSDKDEPSTTADGDQSTGGVQSTGEVQSTGGAQSTTEDNQFTRGDQSTTEGNQSSTNDDNDAEKVTYHNTGASYDSGSNYNSQYFG